MNEYLYNDLKDIEYIKISSDHVRIDRITIFDVDEFRLTEDEQGFIFIRFMSPSREIGYVTIEPNEKLVVDESGDYLIMPEDAT